MKHFSSTLRTSLLLPIAALFLVFGLSPLQSVHAQDMNMDHNMSSSRSSVNNCCVPPSSVAVLKEEEQLPDYEQDDEPEPPEQMPFYAQFQSFPEPSKPVNIHTGSSILIPPDLVKLYGNFRF